MLLFTSVHVTTINFSKLTTNQSGCKPPYSENEIWKVVENIEATQFAFIYQINWYHTVLVGKKKLA